MRVTEVIATVNADISVDAEVILVDFSSSLYLSAGRNRVVGEIQRGVEKGSSWRGRKT